MEEEYSQKLTLGTTSARTLKVIAALIWSIGAAVLVWKGSSLLLQAGKMQSGILWPGIGGAGGIALGGLKGFSIFRASCERNMTRIEALEQPRLWQFFTTRFMLFLALMITTGASLSHFAQGKYLFLILVGMLDLSIATALLTSLPAFWRR